jgi:hypothetical protein
LFSKYDRKESKFKNNKHTSREISQDSVSNVSSSKNFTDSLAVSGQNLTNNARTYFNASNYSELSDHKNVSSII